MEKLTPEQIADKVFELSEQFNRYVFDNPDILNDLPDKAMLVFLDADDPVFNQANLELVCSTFHPDAGPMIYVNMQKRVRVIEQVEWQAKILTAKELS